MTKILPGIFLLMISGICFAQNGVLFRDLTFESALAIADKEDKLLFVDCYTSWCGPCKQMEQNVFPLERVGVYLNARFVCIRQDMEKGEGPMLGKRFQVGAYPTFLVVHPDGSLVHKTVGGADGDTFIKRMEECFEEGKSYGSIIKRYEKGERNKDFLLQCLKACITVKDDRYKEVMMQLMQVLTDEEKQTETYWFIYENTNLSPVKSANESYLFSHYAGFRENVGTEKVNQALYERYKTQLKEAICHQNSILNAEKLERMIENIRALELPEKNELAMYASIAVVMQNSNMNQIISTCDSVLNNLTDGPRLYIEMCDNIILRTNTEEKKQWIALGEKLSKKADDKLKEFMKQVLDYLRK